jgi:hypothetical protein
MYTRTTQHSWCTFSPNKDFPADVVYVKLLRTGRHYYWDSPRYCHKGLTDECKISEAYLLYLVQTKQKQSRTAE